MADSKISALPASTTPLAGTEVLPVVQSSTTRQVSVANLTAGRAISATQLTLTTGNLIVANGQGIDFSATPGTGTSELLDDYEEGTFAATLLFGGTQIGSYNAQGGWYTKIGDTVNFTIFIQVRTKGAATGAVTVGGLPFTSLNTSSRKYSINVTGQSLIGLTGALFGVMDENTTQVGIFQSSATGGTALTDAVFADFSSDNIIVTGTYQS